MTIYHGFSTVGNNFGPYTLSDHKLIVQDFINQLNIRKGEVLHRPNIGCVIWSLLFAPLTPATQNQILTDIGRIIRSDPRLSPQSIVSISQIESGILLDITLYFTNSNQSIALSLLFDQNTGSVIMN